ncbi:MAG: hypothetical protein HKO53_05420 [Gemmatimonadetes bacterium]|nr:hypothetical protein [Gemmatimonadota bacterium]
MERQIFLETEEAGAASASTLAAHEKAVRALESAENARNAVLLGMGALWALNLADAFFVGAVEPVERWDQASRRIQTDLAWVGDGPGVRFLMRF